MIMVNWSAVGIGFVVTIVLEIVGIFFLSLDAAVSTFIGVFAPIIGGLIAAYWAGGTYQEGITNGGLAAGMGSFIAAFIVLSGTSLMPIIISAVISGVIGVVLGIIGGLVGILSKKQEKEKVPPEEPPEND
jgi:hypothetical protein